MRGRGTQILGVRPALRRQLGIHASHPGRVKPRYVGCLLGVTGLGCGLLTDASKPGARARNAGGASIASPVRGKRAGDAIYGPPALTGSSPGP